MRNFRFNQSVMTMLAPGNIEMIGVPERVRNSDREISALLPALQQDRNCTGREGAGISPG